MREELARHRMRCTDRTKLNNALLIGSAPAPISIAVVRLADFPCKQPVAQISVQPRFEKYSAFAVAKINSIDSPVSFPEGRLAIVTNVERGMGWTRRRRRVRGDRRAASRRGIASAHLFSSLKMLIFSSLKMLIVWSMTSRQSRRGRSSGSEGSGGFVVVQRGTLQSVVERIHVSQRGERCQTHS